VSASDATKSKLLVLVDVLIKNEIVLKLLGFGFSILVAQGARKKKEKQRKSIKEKEYLNVRKTFNFTFYHFQAKLFVKTHQNNHKAIIGHAWCLRKCVPTGQ